MKRMKTKDKYLVVPFFENTAVLKYGYLNSGVIYNNDFLKEFVNIAI